MHSIYSTIFNNCFMQDILFPDDFSSLNYTICYRCTGGSKNVYDLLNIFGNQTVICQFCKMNRKHLLNQANMQTLRDAGFPSTIRNGQDYERFAFRLFLNPIPEVGRQITQFRWTHFRNKYVIGVQVRCGGQLADRPEDYVGFDNKTLPGLVVKLKEIAEMQQTNGLPILFFITSDSSYAYEYLAKEIQPFYNVIQSTTYKRGHTTIASVTTEVLRRSVMDVFLLAECDYLVISKRRSFGVLGCVMSKFHQCLVV